MMTSLVELALIALWGALISIHTRRLLRLARLPIRRDGGATLRSSLGRLWYWLGREEFWGSVQADGLRCIQMTLMLFLIVLGMSA